MYKHKLGGTRSWKNVRNHVNLLEHEKIVWRRVQDAIEEIGWEEHLVTTKNHPSDYQSSKQLYSQKAKLESLRTRFAESIASDKSFYYHAIAQ